MHSSKPHVIAIGFSPDNPLPSGFIEVCNCRDWSMMTISHPQLDDPLIASALCIFVTPNIISQLGEEIFKTLVQQTYCPWFLEWHPRKTTPKMLNIAHQLGIFTVRFTTGNTNLEIPLVSINPPSDNDLIDTIIVGDARLSINTGFLVTGLSTCNLSPHQAKLMELLMRNSERFVTPAEIHREIFDNDGTEGDLRMLIKNLREKISDCKQASPRILNVRKQGYRYIEH